MSTAHDQLAAIARDGAQRFATTDLASSHAGVTRQVRRHRVVRGSVTAVAGVGIVGMGAFGAVQLRGADALAPAATSSPSPTVPPSPTAASSPLPSASEAIDVLPGATADVVIADLAAAYNVDSETARAALVAALPPQANGNPEGWIAAGRYATWDKIGSSERGTLAQQATALARGTERVLLQQDVPSDQWLDVVTIASIAQEADRPEDMAGIAAVITNRLNASMMLEIESPLRYYAEINDLEPSDDGWVIDTQYNTYMYTGLPPTPIGAPSAEAIHAAARPAEGDWLYYVRDSATGAVMFATTFEEHQQNLVEVGAIEPGDVG